MVRVLGLGFGVRGLRVRKGNPEALDWLDDNEMAKTDEIQDKQKELEAVVNPILGKIAAGGGANAIQMLRGPESMPGQPMPGMPMPGLGEVE